ncbi:MAG: Hsp70 family protein [Haloplanus sp.]
MKIGIDLGTTNSAMAYTTKDGETEMILNDRSEKTTPSVVLIEEEEEGDDAVTVGEAANNKRLLHPNRILERTKQDIDTEEDVVYERGGEEYDPIDAAAYILAKLKRDAENKLDEEVESAVITVPYDFGDRGRKATKDAAAVADLDVEEIINEPTAACLSYIHQNDVEGTVMVYDFGGGTFDATLVESGANINVISTEGDGQLGGEDIDDALYEHVRQQLIDDGYPDPEDDVNKKDTLRGDLKELKHQLSHRPEEMFTFQTGEGAEGIELDREEFNDIVEELIDRTISTTEDLFEKDTVTEAGITVDSVDHVLMVGGSTRIPLVRERVEEFFGQEPKLNTDPDTVVARGAALQAAYYDERVPIDALPDATIQNVLSHSLGVETNEGVFDQIFEEDTTVPEEKTKQYQNPSDGTATIIVEAVQKGTPGEPVDNDEPERLGNFEIDNVPGNARIDVTFDVENDGTLHVSASTPSGKGGDMTIEDHIGLSEGGIQKKQEGEGDKPSPVDEFAPTPQEGESDD